MRKRNLIAFEDWGSFFFLSNAIGFCSRFRAWLKTPIGLKGAKTYKVCGEGFVRKGNLIVFEDWGGFFFLSNAIGFCPRFRAWLKTPIGLKGAKTYKVCGEGFVRKGNLIVFGLLSHKHYRVLLALQGLAENAYRFGSYYFILYLFTMDYHQPLSAETTYHIFSRAIGNEKLFLTPENYKFFLRRFDLYISPIADVYAFSLLPNHFHAIVDIKPYDHLLPLYKAVKKSMSNMKHGSLIL